MHSEASVGARMDMIWQEAIRLMKAALPMVLVYVLVLCGIGLWWDQSEEFFSLAYLLYVVVSTGLGYWMVWSLITKGGLAEAPLRGGFGIYFGLALLSGIATSIGFVLLIIPGLILLVRWMPIYGFGLIEGDGVSEAMGRSWDATGPHFAAILAAMAVPVALYLAGTGITYLAFDDMGNVILGYSIVSNLLMTLSSAATAAIGIAVYALLEDPQGSVAEVFE